MASRVRVEIDGAALVFRLPTAAEVREYLEAARRPEAPQLELSLDLCAACCLSARDEFDRVADERPLAIADAVLPRLFTAARDQQQRVGRAAVARWRQAETSLARIAENLLAFKAYSGGEPSEQALAGALHVAEWLDASRGTFRLIHALMKGLSRRGR